jgi:hypothetical protein
MYVLQCLLAIPRLHDNEGDGTLWGEQSVDDAHAMPSMPLAASAHGASITPASAVQLSYVRKPATTLLRNIFRLRLRLGRPNWLHVV